MTAPKFTPGPWKWRGRAYVEGPTGRTIADCNVDNVGEEFAEDLANAQLCAAAPDLYAALEPLAVWAEHERRKHMAQGEEGECEYMGALADAARAALAKARGEVQQ